MLKLTCVLFKGYIIGLGGAGKWPHCYIFWMKYHCQIVEHCIGPEKKILNDQLIYLVHFFKFIDEEAKGTNIAPWMC